MDKLRNSNCLPRRTASLSNETAGAILRESSHLPQREKQIVLGIVRGFARPAE
jgi:hypothetical protein